MSKTEAPFQHQTQREGKSVTLRKQLVLYATVGTLVSATAFCAIAAIACESIEGLPGPSAPEISTQCRLPGGRGLDIAIGGLEPIPGRQIHAFEIFSFPHDGKLPVDDIHVQIWWETTHGLPSFPQDLPPIIRLGR